tara:strand:- start:282 stop:500 length:219 start_codon:yes stop_codon:yes gene_type:complete
MKTTSVLIHFNEIARDHLNDLGFKFKEVDGELNVYVDDIPYEIVDGVYQDPDEQLCEHYGIDYGLVNCIELA